MSKNPGNFVHGELEQLLINKRARFKRAFLFQNDSGFTIIA